MNRLTKLIFRPLRTAPAALTLGLALVSGPVATAQQGGITVTVTGEAEATPDLLVFEGTLMESAESADDAVVAFRDTRRRAIQALEAMEIDGLSVKTSGLRVSQGGDMADAMGGMMIGPGLGGDEIQTPPGELAISQTVTVQIEGVSAMEEADLIDLIVEVGEAIEEAGISIGAMTQEDMMMMQFGQGVPSSDVAMFRVSDPEAARAEAAAQAMAKARQQAERLAQLAGVELGGVTAIVEGIPTSDAGNENSYMQMIFGLMAEDSDAMSTASHDPIPVTTTLTVTFAID
ncbi:SIMPL domain-containing protein [Phycisphaeraceae bacterium D3-23]